MPGPTPRVALPPPTYATLKCGACYSIAGTGNKKGSLAGVGTKLTAKQIREWIVNPIEFLALLYLRCVLRTRSRRQEKHSQDDNGNGSLIAFLAR